MRHGAVGARTFGRCRGSKSAGLTVYWNAPTRPHDVQKQIALLEKVVALRYRGIVLAPDETLALRTPIKNALATHIPIVVVGTELGIDPAQQPIVRVER